MVKFRPIAYNEGDFRAYKWVGTDGVTEGIWAIVASADQHTIYVKQWSAGFAITPGTMQNLMLKGRDYIFPVYREDPDIENVGATINTNDMVIGFHGSEFEVHGTACHGTYTSAFYAVGTYVGLATSSQIQPAIQTNCSDVIIGQSLGVYNSWVRIRRIG